MMFNKTTFKMVLVALVAVAAANRVEPVRKIVYGS